MAVSHFLGPLHYITRGTYIFLSRFLPSCLHSPIRRSIGSYNATDILSKIISAMPNFVLTQLFTRLPYPTNDHSGQTIIVTGSNVGLGFEASRHFTRLNAEKVILAVRSLEKGQKAKESIEESTQRHGVVEVWQLDLSSYESVKQFANRAEGLKRLDVLVENAGIAKNQYSVLEDNEAQITVNVVSTFLLGLLLLPKLRESGSKYNFTPHLSIVSSEVHGWTELTEKHAPEIFKELNDKEKADMEQRRVIELGEY